MALADLVVVMNDGRIEQAASPREVFERPATAFVARFMGDHNVIAGKAAGATNGLVSFDVLGGGTFTATGAAVPAGTMVDAAIRTDHVRIGESPVKGLGFTGLVTNLEYRGATIKLTIEGAGIAEFTAIITDRAFYATPVAVGDAVPLHWDAEDAIVLGRPD